MLFKSRKAPRKAFQLVPIGCYKHGASIVLMIPLTTLSDRFRPTELFSTLPSAIYTSYHCLRATIRNTTNHFLCTSVFPPFPLQLFSILEITRRSSIDRRFATKVSLRSFLMHKFTKAGQALPYCPIALKICYSTLLCYRSNKFLV